MLKRMMAAQLVQPSGIAGRHILPRLWNRRNAALNEAALRSLHLEKEDRGLEVGYGGGGYLLGRMLKTVTEGTVVGVDVSPVMTAACARRLARETATGRLALMCAAVEMLPFQDHVFSRVCSVNSLFYWRNLREGLDELHRVLIPGGLLVLVFTEKGDLDGRGFGHFGVRSLSVDLVVQALYEAVFRDMTIDHAADRYRQFLVMTAVPCCDATPGL
ncbi:class I SAM-dependent methyltransferase [bacterium]|nr:class I SAM-dependent methyltransferase [candidate division CSSED10-310 bacterium]